MIASSDRIKEMLNSHRLDALVAFARENVYYLSGYQTLDIRDFAFVIFPLDDEPVLLVSKTDEYYVDEEWRRKARYFGRYYVEGVPKTAGDFEDAAEGVASILAQFGLKHVGLDERALNIDLYDRVRAKAPACTFEKGSDIFDELRMIKSEREIRQITNSLRVTERALLSTYDKVHEGMTELDVANELRIALAVERADCSWVEMGGAAGVPTYPDPKHAIKKGEILHIDVGSIYEGYACDTSRDAVIGEPSDRQREINETVSCALDKSIESIRPGVRASDVFKTGQETVKKTFPQYWRHQIGHGTGIIPHEPPRISPENDRPLRAGMVLDIEIPYYIYGFGTFNVEDTVVVTERGHEVLSRLDRQLSILG